MSGRTKSDKLRKTGGLDFQPLAMTSRLRRCHFFRPALVSQLLKELGIGKLSAEPAVDRGGRSKWVFHQFPSFCWESLEKNFFVFGERVCSASLLNLLRHWKGKYTTKRAPMQQCEFCGQKGGRENKAGEDSNEKHGPLHSEFKYLAFTEQ